MSKTNTQLLDRIRSRGAKQTEFNYGILTADRWVKNLQDLVGLDTCYRYASRANVSYTDALQKAAETLTYWNPEMVVEQKYATTDDLQGLALPKNTLMAFLHTLTSPKKDRDGDILRTEGGVVDPKMLLLWQHVHTLPIGKMVGIAHHDTTKLSVVSAIVDINELAHDAAVMVDNDMARFSHGFRALEFEELEEDEDSKGFFPGFDVKRFEIMEESVVSVPSNTDAEVTDVIVSLVENGKLTSGIMKETGRSLRSKMPLAVAVGIEFEKEVVDADQPGNRSLTEKAGGAEGLRGCTPKEAQVASTEANSPQDEKVALRARAVRLPDTKHFDVELEHLEASKLEYEWASRWLGCQIKEMEVVSTFVPGYRKGSFLTGFKVETSGWELRDVRNLTPQGREEPPFHEVIQLNSRLSDTFLVAGMEFLKTKSGDHVCVKRSPVFGGLGVMTYVKRGSQSGNDVIDKAWAWAQANNFLKGEAFSLSGDFIKRDGTSWDGIFLSSKNKEPLQRLTQLINDKQGSMPNRGIVAMGPPGTGKTLSGRAILNEANATFIWVAAKDFWHMGAVGGLCSAFDLARELAPSVIFIEDVDNWMSDYAVDVLKTEMDGISRSTGVSTVLTTNYPERFPDALIDRPGRFHDVLLFDLPDAKVRLEMLVKWTEGADPAVLEKLVGKTKGYSGAHIYELVSFARSLQKESDDLGIDQALEKAVAKIDEQRSLIDQAQLSGSNYRPRREASPGVKSYLARMKASERKSGRALSQKTRRVLQDVRDDLDYICKDETLSRGSYALCERCSTKLGSLMDEAEEVSEVETSAQDIETKQPLVEEREISAQEAAAIFFAKSTQEEQQYVLSALEVIRQVAQQDQKVEHFRALLS